MVLEGVSAGGEWYRWVVYVSGVRVSAVVEYRRGECCGEWCKCVGECVVLEGVSVPGSVDDVCGCTGLCP